MFFYSFELFSMCAIKTNSGEFTNTQVKSEDLRVPPLYQSAIENGVLLCKINIFIFHPRLLLLFL